MKVRKSFIIGIIITLLLLIGAAAAYYLSQQTQDVRQRASEPTTTNPFNKAAHLSAENPPVEPISIPDISTHDQSFTLEFWVNPSSTQTNESIGFPLISTTSPQEATNCVDEFILSGARIDSGDTYAIHVAINPFNTDGGALSSQNHPLSYNQWSNIAFTIDNAKKQAKLFVNGVLTDTISLPRTYCSDLSYKIGYAANQDMSNMTLVGSLDELRLSNSLRYTDTFTPTTTPFSSDTNTLGLWHFDGNLNNEFDNKPLNNPSDAVTYVDSAIVSSQVPACQVTVSTCSWSAATDAVSYHYKITRDFAGDVPTPAPDQYLVKEGDVTAPKTSINFPSEANVSYTCEVYAVNACGKGDSGRGTQSCIVPTPSAPTPTPTVPEPTATPTDIPPSPTATTVPPKPTATPTDIPPSPTATTVPPTATVIPTATNTPLPGIPTNTPTPTIPSPGSTVQTLTIAGGIIFTILGALILFVL